MDISSWYIGIDRKMHFISMQTPGMGSLQPDRDREQCIELGLENIALPEESIEVHSRRLGQKNLQFTNALLLAEESRIRNCSQPLLIVCDSMNCLE